MGFTIWEFDPARKKHCYYDPERKSYVYEDGSEILIPSSTVGLYGSEAERTTSNASSGPSHGRVSSGASSDYSFASDLSNLSISDTSTAVSSSGNDSLVYPTNTSRPLTGATGGYATPKHASSGTQRPTYLAGYSQQPSYETHHQAHYHSLDPKAVATYRGAHSHTNHVPSQPTTQAVFGSRPSDEELLYNVGRNVVLRPDARSTPADLLQLGVKPHMRINGTSKTHGNRERLNPSFQIRYPGYNFYKTGKVFRVLWPELAGDVNQNITIATAPYGENVFYKIRWFVVVREGHDCCTCLSIQTYRRRGVPPNKPKHHHAIIYTGDCEPQPLASEKVAGEPPMGDSICVIGNEIWNKMDPMSRVNFAKPYTVEHNVKVEDFGHVDPSDEWKLIAQFNSHWGIQGTEALPPATKSRYYDGHTYGPAPGTCAPPYAGSSAAAVAHSSYNTNLATQTAYAPYSMAPINEDTRAGHQAQHYAQNRYTPSENSSYHPTTEDEDPYESVARPTHHRRSSSHRSDQTHGSQGKRRLY